MGKALQAYRRYRELAHRGEFGRVGDVLDENWIENCPAKVDSFYPGGHEGGHGGQLAARAASCVTGSGGPDLTGARSSCISPKDHTHGKGPCSRPILAGRQRRQGLAAAGRRGQSPATMTGRILSLPDGRYRVS
jgi:hypothetical protein